MCHFGVLFCYGVLCDITIHPMLKGAFMTYKTILTFGHHRLIYSPNHDPYRHLPIVFFVLCMVVNFGVWIAFITLMLNALASFGLVANFSGKFIIIGLVLAVGASRFKSGSFALIGTQGTPTPTTPTVKLGQWVLLGILAILCVALLYCRYYLKLPITNPQSVWGSASVVALALPHYLGRLLMPIDGVSIK